MIFPIVLVALLLLLGIFLYNGLINRRNQVDNAFGTIDAMLLKRYDLIPNLVESVKAYMTHEKDTLTQIVELRNATHANPEMRPQQRMDIENQITGLLSGIRVAVENYPELKSSENFVQLQRSWNEVGAQLAAARRSYNASVTSYNNAVEMFPSNIMARWMRYDTMEVLQIEEAQRGNVSAKDLFGNN